MFLCNAIFIVEIYSTFKHATGFARKKKAISDQAEKDDSLQVIRKASSWNRKTTIIKKDNGNQIM